VSNRLGVESAKGIYFDKNYAQVKQKKSIVGELPENYTTNLPQRADAALFLWEIAISKLGNKTQALANESNSGKKEAGIGLKRIRAIQRMWCYGV